MNDKNTQSDQVFDRESGLTRRQFIKTAGLVAGVALTEGSLLVSAPKPVLSGAEGTAAPTVLKGTKLHLLQLSSFVPPADDETRRQAAEWCQQTGARVTIETINANDLQARIAAAIENGTGADIMQMLHNWPHLYAKGCVNVDDVGEKVEKTYGSTS